MSVNNQNRQILQSPTRSGQVVSDVSFLNIYQAKKVKWFLLNFFFEKGFSDRVMDDPVVDSTDMDGCAVVA